MHLNLNTHICYFRDDFIKINDENIPPGKEAQVIYFELAGCPIDYNQRIKINFFSTQDVKTVIP